MSVTNEQVLAAVTALTERVEAIAKADTAATLEMIGAMRSMSNNMDRIHALLEGRTQYDQSFFQGQQHILQNLQFMQHAMSQLQASLSIAYPGIYNHPTQGLQYPARQQHFTGQHSVDGIDPGTRARMVMDQMHQFGSGRGAYNTQRDGMIRQPYGQRGAFVQQPVFKTFHQLTQEAAETNLGFATPWVGGVVEQRYYQENHLTRSLATTYAEAYNHLKAVIPPDLVVDGHMLYSGVDENHESVKTIVEGTKKLQALLQKSAHPNEYIQLGLELAEDTVTLSKEILEANPSYSVLNYKSMVAGDAALIFIPVATPHGIGVSNLTGNRMVIEKQFLVAMVESGESVNYEIRNFESLIAQHIGRAFEVMKDAPAMFVASMSPLIGNDPFYNNDVGRTFPGLKGPLGAVGLRMITVLIVPSAVDQPCPSL